MSALSTTECHQVSVFRDDAPWLHELTLDAHRGFLADVALTRDPIRGSKQMLQLLSRHTSAAGNSEKARTTRVRSRSVSTPANGEFCRSVTVGGAVSHHRLQPSELRQMTATVTSA